MGVQGYTLLGGHWPDGNVAGAQKPLQTNVMQIPSYGSLLPSIAVASTQQFHPCKTFGVSRENTIIWDWSHIRTPNLGASLMRPHTFNELFISSNREYF